MSTVSGARQGHRGVSTLILSARNGGPVALGRLLDAAYGYLTFIAAGQMGREYAAKFGISDVVQESAKDAQRGFGTFQGHTTGEFFAWLRTIVRRNLKDEVRKHARGVGRQWPLDTVTDIAVPGDADERLMRDDMERLVNAAIARVPEQYAIVLRLRYWEGLTFVDIGARMGRSDEAVRKLWGRALLRLREELSDGDGSGL